MTPLLGIDLGGTKIEIVALDGAGGVMMRRRVATPGGDYAATIRAIADLVAEADASVGRAERIGVATPGALSPFSGLIKNANSTCLNGRALDRDLADALGRPVRLANDADCFALSEATDGAGQGAGGVFGAILGTGVGGGLVLNGRLVQGINRIAGEWGHNPLPWPRVIDRYDERPGPACYCGKHGCIETFLSGPGFARDHAQGDEPMDAAAIVVAAGQGDARAKASLARYVDRLARALAGVINLVDPEIIVLGGGMSNIASLYDEVPRAWESHAFSDRLLTRLKPPRHGDSSGVRGAAWLWRDAV
jgi:fructokinase